jgi:hypothetical protein
MLFWEKWYWDRILSEYGRTPLILVNWDGEPSGYAENPDNWIFLSKQATLAVCISAVIIDSLYLRLNLSTMPDLELYKP